MRPTNPEDVDEHPPGDTAEDGQWGPTRGSGRGGRTRDRSSVERSTERSVSNRRGRTGGSMRGRNPTRSCGRGQGTGFTRDSRQSSNPHRTGNWTFRSQDHSLTWTPSRTPYTPGGHNGQPAPGHQAGDRPGRPQTKTNPNLGLEAGTLDWSH